MLFHLPIVASVIFIGLTILNKFPHTFNYLQEITIENAFKQYRNATRMMRVLKLIIVLIFGLISYQVIKHATGEIEGLGSWFLPFVLISIFVPTIYFMINLLNPKSFVIKKNFGKSWFDFGLNGCDGIQ